MNCLRDAVRYFTVVMVLLAGWSGYARSTELISDISGYTCDYVNLFIYLGDNPQGSMMPVYTTSFHLAPGPFFNTISLYYECTDSIEQAQDCGGGMCLMIDSLGNPVCYYQTKYGPAFNLGRIPAGDYIVTDSMAGGAVLDTITVDPVAMVNVSPQHPVRDLFYRGLVLDERDSVRLNFDFGATFRDNYTIKESVRVVHPLWSYIPLREVVCTDSNRIDVRDAQIVVRTGGLTIPPLMAGQFAVEYKGATLDSFRVYSLAEALDTFRVVPEQPVYGESFSFEILIAIKASESIVCNWNYPQDIDFVSSLDSCDSYFMAWAPMCLYTLDEYPCRPPQMPPIFPAAWRCAGAVKTEPYGFIMCSLAASRGNIEPDAYNVYWSTMMYLKLCPNDQYRKIGAVSVLPDLAVNDESMTSANSIFTILSNPVRNFTAIQLDRSHLPADIYIYDMNGVSTARFINVTESAIALDVSGYNSGLYGVKVVSGNRIGIQKMIIQNSDN